MYMYIYYMYMYIYIYEFSGDFIEQMSFDLQQMRN
jgi:hypothetical protein